MRYLFPNRLAQPNLVDRTSRAGGSPSGTGQRARPQGRSRASRRELLTSEIGSVQRHSGSVVPLATTAHHHPLCSGTSGTAIPGQPQNRGIVTESLLLVFQDELMVFRRTTSDRVVEADARSTTSMNLSTPNGSPVSERPSVTPSV